MQKNLYRGFCSHEFKENKTFRIRDIELVKLDLLNHIFTERGSRVMMPNFGSIIPLLTFEPLVEEVVDTVYDELEYIFNYDPRVEIQNLEVTPDYDASVIMARAQLFYIELNMSDILELNIEFGQ